MKKLLSSLVAFFVFCCAAASAADVDVDGVSISYRQSSGASPTIIFDSGLGDGLESWDSIFPLVEQFSSAIAWSRPGLGESADSPIDDDGVRTSAETAGVLERFLGKVGAQPPYILIGHSLGGLNVLKYAELHPDQVAAILLVDPRPARFRARCAERGLAACSAARVAPDAWPRAIKAEIAGTGPSEEDVATPLSLGARPVTVIVSTTPWAGDGGEEAFAFWLEAQEEFANSVPNGRFVRAEGTGHYVHKDNRALVAEEIKAIMARVNRPE